MGRGGKGKGGQGGRKGGGGARNVGKTAKCPREAGKELQSGKANPRSPSIQMQPVQPADDIVRRQTSSVRCEETRAVSGGTSVRTSTTRESREVQESMHSCSKEADVAAGGDADLDDTKILDVAESGDEENPGLVMNLSASRCDAGKWRT